MLAATAGIAMLAATKRKTVERKEAPAAAATETDAWFV
jgi:hypothetical protein